MVRISVDAVGPLPEDSNGFTHIVVITDQFSRYVELYPTKGTRAEDAAYPLLDWFCRYGVADMLQSDAGTQFVNELITQFLTLVDTVHLRSRPNSHQDNAIIERRNKEVLRHLRALLIDYGKTPQWSGYLPLVRRIMNATPHEITKIAPVKLVLNHAMDLERGFVTKFMEAKQNPTYVEYVNKMIAVHEDLLIKANDFQLKEYQRQQEQEQNAPTSSDTVSYAPGSFVLVAPAFGPAGRRPVNKLKAPWRGPMKVISSDRGQYTLMNMEDHKEEHQHVTALKPYHYDKNFPSPREVANRERNQFDVEFILDHRGQRSATGTLLKDKLEFRVHWLGYSDDYDTWEPWKNLRTNGILHAYLRRKLLHFLIPTDFRVPEDDDHPGPRRNSPAWRALGLPTPQSPDDSRREVPHTVEPRRITTRRHKRPRTNRDP